MSDTVKQQEGFVYVQDGKPITIEQFCESQTEAEAKAAAFAKNSNLPVIVLPAVVYHP
ncbi:hypothetical protein [Botrimarina mediterranea]|uniref:Uncharacterized protein n=1 Tax=Botrimarina mediterranea TaxID=2528022 RepID=A0A518K9I2_9BACT|nr:hypothetical protein [Botrimarina mediterranea]QDV74455.1 hypothetical protein Spa11_26580 [Botrimarina mediterranea]QDV79051.1 hypothetical protein K2D_26600 [Planctomycetes bacterium K2D]